MVNYTEHDAIHDTQKRYLVFIKNTEEMFYRGDLSPDMMKTQVRNIITSLSMCYQSMRKQCIDEAAKTILNYVDRPLLPVFVKHFKEHIERNKDVDHIYKTSPPQIRDIEWVQILIDSYLSCIHEISSKTPIYLRESELIDIGFRASATIAGMYSSRIDKIGSHIKTCPNLDFRKIHREKVDLLNRIQRDIDVDIEKMIKDLDCTPPEKQRMLADSIINTNTDCTIIVNYFSYYIAEYIVGVTSYITTANKVFNSLS